MKNSDGKILLLPGDGIGPEVNEALKDVIDSIDSNTAVNIEIEEGYQTVTVGKDERIPIIVNVETSSSASGLLYAYLEVRSTSDITKTSDVKLAERVCQNDDEVDGLKDRVINELLQIMMKDPTASRQATYLIFIAHNLERIADRSTNIAEDTIFLATGSSRSID